MPPYTRLTDARVEPATGNGKQIGRGGGIVSGDGVPDYAQAFRDGSVFDEPVTPSDTAPRVLRGEYVWGGEAVQKVGHFTAETAPRLLEPSRAHPDAKVLFLLEGTSVDDVPSWLWDITSYLHIDRERIEFVFDRPCVVECLYVYPQSEHWTLTLDNNKVPPELDSTGVADAAYLRALAANFSDWRAAPHANDLVYVSRARIPVSFAGEAILAEALEEKGVAVIYPEDLSVLEQMRFYAGAKHLIFAEGSAVHFRQLLGPVDQTITILQRRPGFHVAYRAMLARACMVEYRDLLRGSAYAHQVITTDEYTKWNALPFLCESMVLEYFASLGIDLHEAWDHDEFLRQECLSVARWAQHSHEYSPRNRGRRAIVAGASLTALGIEQACIEEAMTAIDPDLVRRALTDQLIDQTESLRSRLEASVAQIESLTSRVTDLSDRAADLRTQLALEQSRRRAVLTSTAYRLGSRLVQPAAALRRLWTRLRA